MDRNTTIGLILIGLLLTVFTVINQPSKEDIEKAKKFWATHLEISSDIFRIYLKHAVIKTKRKNVGREYNGVLRICVLKSIDFNRKIAGWTEGVVEYLR